MDADELCGSIRDNIHLVVDRDCSDKILPALEGIIRNIALDVPVRDADIIQLAKYIPIYNDGAAIHEIIRRAIAGD